MTVVLVIALLTTENNNTNSVEYISVKGLSPSPTPVPDKIKFSFNNLPTDKMEFWEALAQETQASHLLISTNSPTFTINNSSGNASKSSVISKFVYSIVPTALLISYACNQGQLLTIQVSKSTEEAILNVDIIPIIDYQVQASFSILNLKLEINEEYDIYDRIGGLVWDVAIDVGKEHTGRASLLLENICFVSYSTNTDDGMMELLQKSLEKRVPLTPFCGDQQPKKISFRSQPPSFHCPVPNGLLPFFGGLIAARSIFTMDPLYNKHN